MHPQPHWHIHNTSSFVNAVYVSDFNIFLGIKEEEETDFLDELVEKDDEEVTRNKISDLSGFHFAMCAGWIHDLPDKHILTNNNLLVWLKESLTHIREQLEYSSNRFK